MTPSEKAIELLAKFKKKTTYQYQEYAGANYSTFEHDTDTIKECCLLTVEEVLKAMEPSIQWWAKAYNTHDAEDLGLYDDLVSIGREAVLKALKAEKGADQVGGDFAKLANKYISGAMYRAVRKANSLGAPDRRNMIGDPKKTHLQDLDKDQIAKYGENFVGSWAPEADADNPEKIALDKEQDAARRKLLRILFKTANLTEKQRRVYLLVNGFVGGISGETATAKKLGVSKTAVQNAMRKVRSKIQAALHTNPKLSAYAAKIL